MKRITVLLLAIAIAYLCPAQETHYIGKVHIVQVGPTDNGVYYFNKLSMIVKDDGTATLQMNLKLGPKDMPGDYITFKGTVTGTLNADNFEVAGPVNQTMQDGKNYREGTMPVSIQGQKTENGDIKGTFYLQEVNTKPTVAFTYVLHPEETVPELLFPIGNSPKVFNKGWLFGASFKILDEKNTELDLSDDITWSGTASFEPDKGASSRPVFNSIGANKIVLTVDHNGKKYSKEYAVVTVDALQYARVGSMAYCAADGHLGPVGINQVIGPVITGNGNVLIEGLPAACEGDRGVHASCAGANNFFIADGDPEVLINGKKAAKLESRTQHCGGLGRIVSLSGELSGKMMALSSDVNFSKDGKKIAGNNLPEAGTTVVTGAKGVVLMTPDRSSVMMLMPNTSVFIKKNDGTDLYIELNEGSLTVNGEKADGSKNLVIDGFDEKFIRNGTHYMLTRTKSNTRLIVYEGEVKVELKKENKTIAIPAGKVYFNDYTNPYTISDTTSYQGADVLATIPKDSLQLDLTAIKTTTENKTITGNSILTLVKKYWYAGAAALVLVLLLLVRKRKK